MDDELNKNICIGEALVDGVWYPVYAIEQSNLMTDYPHSHIFDNLPDKLKGFE